MTDLRHKWDAIYHKRKDITPDPALMLTRYAHLLPPKGLALDLACGLGGNAFFMAKQGLQVDAWDISPIAVEHINNNTKTNKVHALAIDINQAKFTPKHYDVIAVSRFLNRDIANALISALKPGGLLFYQTFTLEKVQTGGPSNSRFLLNKGELLSLFAPLSVVIYHEESTLGDIKKGIRNEAILIASKPVI